MYSNAYERGEVDPSTSTVKNNPLGPRIPTSPLPQILFARFNFFSLLTPVRSHPVIHLARKTQHRCRYNVACFVRFSRLDLQQVTFALCISDYLVRRSRVFFRYAGVYFFCFFCRCCFFGDYGSRLGCSMLDVLWYMPRVCVC